MAFCSECGSELELNAKFCQVCGAKVGAPSASNNISSTHDVFLLSQIETNTNLFVQQYLFIN